MNPPWSIAVAALAGAEAAFKKEIPVRTVYEIEHRSSFFLLPAASISERSTKSHR